jgi:pimeloyl-ACP methyl ester carboxylesterase
MGVRLICYDRPGYGDSDRAEGRDVADAADDVAAIADEYGLGAFAVVGRSGGGPHALACAARLAGRITRAAILVPVAPVGAEGLDWYEGMTAQNVEDYDTAEQDLGALIRHVKGRTDEIEKDPEFLVRLLRPALMHMDRRVIDDFALRKLITDSYAEAVKHGPYGWIDDMLALRKPWNFDLAGITAPVRLWHGADDAFAPVSHTRWLASQIPTAQMEVVANLGHFAAVEVLPEILSWLIDTDEPPYAHPAEVVRRAGADRQALASGGRRAHRATSN